jgi:hypothetical protein
MTTEPGEKVVQGIRRASVAPVKASSIEYDQSVHVSRAGRQCNIFSTPRMGRGVSGLLLTRISLIRFDFSSYHQVSAPIGKNGNPP